MTVALTSENKFSFGFDILITPKTIMERSWENFCCWTPFYMTMLTDCLGGVDCLRVSVESFYSWGRGGETLLTGS